MKRAWLFLLLLCWASAHAAGRALPQPLADHPGNIFLAGEEVVIQVPSGDEPTWQLVGYDENVFHSGRYEDGPLRLGRLPCGYYEVRRRAGELTNRVSVGILEPLRAPTPRTSPICADAALAWLVAPEKIEQVANLASLAGMNWLRDRLNWAEIEPSRGQYASSNRYDFSVRHQAAAGLQILEVTHSSPSWANPNGKRFPLDLRDAFEYHRSLARRWNGKVGAFEPWNEADIEVFGGHIGSEIASFQKASYLGIKAGNPRAIGCLNVFAVHRRSTLDDFAANEVWGYFDTYNLHHYEPFPAYARLYADHRAVSVGKPLWVTECSLPVKWAGDPHAQEPTPEDLRIQSERVVMTYALALHEGARAVFFFILPHYVEGQTQFGLLRRDLTPRPGFLAMAAAGRLLADAQPLGRLNSGKDVHGFLFRARPDGQKAHVLVIWSERAQDFKLPAKGRCFDHLGRERDAKDNALKVGRQPLFVVFAQRPQLSLIPPPAAPEPLKGKPGPVVLQALMPESAVSLKDSAYRVAPGKRVEVPLFVYNFGPKPASGQLTVEMPAGWRAETPAKIEVNPGERTKLDFFLTAQKATEAETNAVPVRLSLTGKFATAVLSLRFIPAGN